MVVGWLSGGCRVAVGWLLGGCRVVVGWLLVVGVVGFRADGCRLTTQY